MAAPEAGVPKVEFTCVLGRHNADALDTLVDTAEDLGMSVIFQPLRDSLFQGTDRDGSTFMLSNEELRTVLRRGGRAAFDGLPRWACGQCWCARAVEGNYRWRARIDKMLPIRAGALRRCSEPEAGSVRRPLPRGSEARSRKMSGYRRSAPAIALLAASAAGALPAREASGQEISPPDIPAREYAARRARILAALPDGILLLHARSAQKTMEQWGFVQDPSFLYFTGLADLPGAILALDGLRKETRLFVPPAPTSFGFPVEGLVPAPGKGAAREIGLDAVRPWAEFAAYIEGRLAEGVGKLYVDEPRRPEAAGVPPGFRPAAGSLALWRATLKERFPAVRRESAKSAIRALRRVKSPAETAILRRNARATAAALQAVARRLKPGLTQREAEGTVVAACLAHGAQGPSFWPWVMTGPNAHVRRLVHAFFRYDQLNRVMRSGEMARVDIGCAGGRYGADVGRTLPVSGRFSPGQREAWNLLIRGYRAGMEAMSAGVTLKAVRAASAAAVLEARSGLATTTGREAADALLSGGAGVWHIHGVGIESGEDAGPVLEAGSVIAFEPMIEVGPDAFYLEDMILITPEGLEVLSAGLPYWAREIEAAMEPEPPR